LSYDRRTWDGALSGAGLAPGEEPAGEDDLLPVDADRFEEGGLLGAGGMGEVRLARDRVLQRDVAMKMPRSSDLGAARQLLHEARLTARLEHPGVVPVHLAGLTPEGRPYYAMRLLRGQTLADAMHEAADLPARLALVRRLLDVAQALSFAHDQRVLHRDLKPSNIMVGAYGETVVTDWGLAIDLRQPAPPGGHVTAGTPGYMPPEQERGGPPDARSDVYAVGAMLHELLDGRLPPGPVGPGAPPELVAVARRATAVDVADRYEDMAALARDLERWFEGRRVSAHSYSPGELLVRAVRAWRAPLTVAAMGLVALAVAISAGWRSTQAERDRAVVAERDARDSLGQALSAQARLAAGEDRRADAELLAAHALLSGPSPVARGVIARFGGRWRPALVERRDAPPCLARSMSPDGRLLACRRDADVVVIDPAGLEVGRIDEAVHVAAFTGVGDQLLVGTTDGGMMLWEPGEAPRLVMEGPASLPYVYPRREGAAWLRSSEGGRVGLDGEIWVAMVCAETGAVTAVSAMTSDALVASCSDGQVFYQPRGGPRTAWYASYGDAGAPSSLAVDPDQRTLAVGLPRGQVVVVDLATGAERMTLSADSSAVRRMSLRGDRLALATDSGRVEVFDLSTGASLLRTAANDSWIGWVDDDELVIAAEQVERWRLDDAPRRHVWTVPGGVSSLSLRGDGVVAVGQGSGDVHLVHPDEGAPRAVVRWQDEPIKDVAFDPATHRLAVSATLEDSFRVYDGDGATLLATLPTKTARRLVWGVDGRLFVARYSVGAAVFPADLSNTPELVSDRQIADLEGNGRFIGGVADDGEVWGWDGDQRWHFRIAGSPGAVAPIGPDVVVGLRRAVARFDPAGVEVARWGVGGDVADLQVSPDGRWLAVGLLEGGVDLLSLPGGALVARLEGHTNRVPTLAFSADGQWLVSGSWDQTVRWWSLAELEEAPDALVARLTAAWGRSLDDVLRVGR
jgi:WD40 repeat protein